MHPVLAIAFVVGLTSLPHAGHASSPPSSDVGTSHLSSDVGVSHLPADPPGTPVRTFARAVRVVPLNPPTRRWGLHGHRLAARAAAAHLPDEMPGFFRGSRAQLEYLNPEPDRWRDSGSREMNESFRYDHYLDLEAVPDEAFHARDRWEFLRALYSAGIETPEQEVGLLPFRVTELFQRLENGFRRWRDETNPEVRRWLEERIVHDAGILGHYVTDASQPHHATIHFNGWNEELEENPEGFTTDRQFHARFESRFVEAHLREVHVMQDFPEEPSPLGEPLETIWAFVHDSNAEVRRLYELDRDHGFEPDEPAHPESLAFAAERLRAGAVLLRDLWWAAWTASARAPDSP